MTRVLGIPITRRTIVALAQLTTILALAAVLMILRVDSLPRAIALTVVATVATVFATAFWALLARRR